MVAQDIEAWTAKPTATRLGERDEADVRWFWNEAEAEFGMRSNFGMQIEMLQLFNMSDGHRGQTDDERSRGAAHRARAREAKKDPALAPIRWQCTQENPGPVDFAISRTARRAALEAYAKEHGRDAANWLIDGFDPEDDADADDDGDATWNNPWTDRNVDSAGRYRFIYDVMTSLDVGHMRALWLVYGPELDEVRGCLRRLTRKEGPDPRRDDPVMRPHYARLGDLTLVAEDTDEARAAAAEWKATPRATLAKRIDKEDILRLRVKNAAEKTVTAACHAYVMARGPEKRRDESWARYRRRRTAEVV